MGKDYRTEDGAQIAPLSDLKDFQVAEGYKDVRGWRVDSADGKEIGKVHDLLVDLDGMRTRYLDIRLDDKISASHGDRDVLVPIGSARFAEDGDRVVLPLNADRAALLPPYDHGRLTRSYESEVRRHFTLGEAAAGAAGAAAGASAAAATRTDNAADKAAEKTTDKPVGFYDHEAYDDRRFFQSRKEKEIAKAERDAKNAAGTDQTVARIPVAAEDSVVLKRGEGGNDEIIVRRPQT
jgi:photosynthetic reaction center H subunit